MDPADNARRSTVLREGARGARRSQEVREQLADPALASHLAEVDRRWPRLLDGERLRVAKILAANSPGQHVSLILGGPR